MKDFYHGTTPQIANELHKRKVSLSFGGGEFGKGFYVGSSLRLARRRGFHKTTDKIGTASEAMNYYGNVFVIKFDETKFSQYYKPKKLTKDEAVALFRKLSKKPKTTSSYTVSAQYDYIVGPVVGGRKRYLDVIQYKFDSQKTEDYLNGHCQNINLVSEVI
ncbi:hypothetical protein HJ052_11130 [Vibrio parahaemolyticus]|nr:hypothetical protein [Vibrio parahaemolyticus]